MWIIYLTIEILMLVIFILMKIFGVEGMVVDIIKILPIGFNLIFTLGKKGMLKNALIFTLIADCCFLLEKNALWGIAFFVVVQFYYYFYLEEFDFKILLMCLINFLFVIFFKESVLIVEAFIYAFMFCLNLVILKRKLKNNDKLFIFNYVLLFLLGCDCFVLIQYLFGFSKWVEGIIEVVEWTFYLTSQIMLVSILYFKNKTIVKESKQ